MRLNGSLLPCTIDTNARRDNTSKADNSVVEGGPAETGGWSGEVAGIAEELELDCGTLPMNLLATVPDS